VTDLSRAPLRLTLATAVVTAVATFGLVRLVSSGPWIWLSLVLILVITVVGHLCRSTSLPRPLIIAAQVVAAALAITALRAHAAAVAGFLPGPGALHLLSAQFSAGRTDIVRESAPAHDTLGITTIMLTISAAFAVLIDAIAVTYRRAVLTGIPLLTVYLIPATRETGGLSWLAFITIAAGYLGLVSADGRDRLGRWGRTVEHSGAIRTAQGANPFDSPHSAMARRIITLAIAAALVVPWFIPTLPHVFIGDGGSGRSVGGGPVSLSQTVDLRNSLSTSTAVPLLSYTTSSANPRGDYLRMSVLDSFDGTSWTIGAEPVSDVATFAAPPIFGLTDPGIAKPAVTTSVTVVGNFTFNTVPTPYAPRSVSGLPNLLYDPDTLVINTGQTVGESRQGQKYTVSSVDVTPTYAQATAAPPVVDNAGLAQFLQLPSDLPAEVRSIAQQVTAGASTPFLKALALQNYFLTNFNYSLSVPAGDGNSAILAFLKNKVGFCQQFAGTMAAMARALGIPAVVAVGFTSGTKQPDGSYIVTTHDAHAWPMLYFQGLGWLRFEPTPSIASSGRGEQPAWTEPNGSTSGTTTSNATATVGATPQPTSSTSICGVSEIARLSPGCRDFGGSGAATRQAFGSLGPLGAVLRWFTRWFLTGSAAVVAVKLLTLVLALIATFPAIGRLLRRRARRSMVRQAQRYLARVAETGTGAAEQLPTAKGRGGRRPRRPDRSELTDLAAAAWSELRESAEDLGYTWADSDTPREAAVRLTAAAGLDEPATAAIGRVTALTEQVRYSPTAVVDPATLQGIAGDLRTVRGALAGHADRATRLKAAILPNSSLALLRDRRDRTSLRAYRLLGSGRHESRSDRDQDRDQAG
jgi:transglutaminase-like putative cysteine protease